MDLMAGRIDHVPVSPLRVRLARVATLTVLGLAILAIVVQLFVGFAFLNWGASDWGGDFRGYLDASQGWLNGNGFYLSRQLQGPYETQLGDVLYPPTTLYVFIPFLFLPAQSWWILAIVPLIYVIWSWRPALWAVALMLACLAYPNLANMYFRGSPVIVIAALVAAALRWHWPGALILLKPSVLPFALIGIRTRGWWVTAGLLVILTLPLLALIPDWLQAVIDSRGYGGLLYGGRDLPLLMVPVLAYLGRTRHPESAMWCSVRRRRAELQAPG
jgi:hypothetical protein